jgi:hypothetical protein
MFGFVVKYLGFLKFVPGLAQLFDAWLTAWSSVSHPHLLNWIDEIEGELLAWPDVTSTTHKYGGLQLNYRRYELGHIHSNGLVDVLLSRKLKQQLMVEDSRVNNHHVFKSSGWVSFYMQEASDKKIAISLLTAAYQKYAKPSALLLNKTYRC